jgi:hypothetical protein
VQRSGDFCAAVATDVAPSFARDHLALRSQGHLSFELIPRFPLPPLPPPSIAGSLFASCTLL